MEQKHINSKIKFCKLFSVLISTYINDDSSCLAKALDSIINQSLPPSEIVLIIDGHIKLENEEIINTFALKYPNLFKLVRLETNVGLGNALQIGLNNCTNDLVARMDADDESYYERFEKQVNYFKKNPSLSVVGTFLQEFNKKPGDYSFIKKAPIGQENIKKYANWRNPLNHPSVMFKKKDIIAVGGYKEISLFEDYYLWLRVLKFGYLIDNINESLVNFRIGNDLIGRRHGWAYLKKELHFLNICKRQKLITTASYYKQFCLRLPLRILPKKILQKIYKSFLRK